MATILNNRSSLVTDPIRNFRFLVTFNPHNATTTNATSSSSTGSVTTTTTTTGGGSNALAALGAIKFGFTSVSGLAATTDSIPYREGAYNTTVHQIPGQTSFAPISLSRGMMLGTSQNWNWMKMLFQTVQGSATRGIADTFRCDVTIEILAHPTAYTADASATTGGVDGTQTDFVVQRFKVYNAWISSIAYSDLNAGDNAIFVEQIQMVHEGFEMTLANDLSTQALTIS
jgi:phage tail-like protein